MIDFKEDSKDEKKIDFQLDFQPDEEESSATDEIVNRLKAAGGGLEGAVTMLGQLPAMAAGGLSGLGKLMTGGSIGEANQTMQNVVESNFGFGAPKPVSDYGKLTHEALGHGMEALASGTNQLVGGLTGSDTAGRSAALTAEIGANLLPIPGGKGVRRLGKAIEDLRKPETNLTKEMEAREAPKPVETKIDFQEGEPQVTNVTETNQGLRPTGDVLVEQRLRELDRDLQIKEQVQEAIRGQKDLDALEAQLAIERRQRALEQEVAQRATLDYNAAERARQEQAGVPEPRAKDIDPMAEPDHAATYDLLAQEIDASKPKSGTPAFVEPDSRFPSQPMRVKRGQRGGVNAEVFDETFRKVKELTSGITLKALGTGSDLRIIAMQGNKELGSVVFDSIPHASEVKKYPGLYQNLPKEKSHLESFSTAVNPEMRNKGLAGEMYKFAAELGNDIKASDVQTTQGKLMWDGFNRRGLAEGKYIPKSQRGAINVDALKRGKVNELIKQKDGTYLSKDPDVPSLLPKMQAEKDGRGLNYMASGATLEAMKRGSTAILAASRLVQNAVKRADLKIREVVFPVEKAFRKLSSAELTQLADVFKSEMFGEKRFSADALSLLSTKQLKAYQALRDAFHESWKIQNEKRLADGKKPITELEHYLSSRWQGDFRQPVYQARLDKNGNPVINSDGTIQKQLVWFLAAESERGLKKQLDALLSERKDLEAGDPIVVRNWGRKTDIESAYSTMIDILGRDDPAVQKLQEYIQDIQTGRAEKFLAQQKHFLDKGNIRGFVGDRPGHSGKSEALAMFQQQIDYLKNSFKWEAMQDAGKGIKEIISDPILQETQPNNLKYIREYYKNAVGYGESRLMKVLEDTVKQGTGYDMAAFDRGVGSLKSYFLLNKLAVNAGYVAANLIQTANIMPHMLDLYWKGYRGNPISAMAVGSTGGLTMAFGHYLKSVGTKVEELPVPFLRDMFRYAEDNGVTTRSIYDEAPIESSFSTIGKIGNAMGKTMSGPETFVRAVAFATFADFLRTSGKWEPAIINGKEVWPRELFQLAEERTNAAMVDYRASERPMVFAKAGSAGNFLNTLQTYGFNYYNQHSYLAREAFKGNVLPWVGLIALQYALAGANGVPGFDDGYRMYMHLKDKGLFGMEIPTKYWAQLQDNEFLRDPKLWMLQKWGQPAVYGALSDKSGIGLSTRVSAPTAGQMLTSPAGPPTDIAKQIASLGSAIIDPTNTTKLAQAGMNIAPEGIKGALETAPFMEGITYNKRPDGSLLTRRTSDLKAHEGLYARSPEEQAMRKYTGLRSQKEVATRDITYSLDSAEKGLQQRLPNVLKDFYDAVRRGDKKEAAALQELHIKLTGNPIDTETIENKAMREFTSSVERAQSGAKTLEEIKNAARMKKIMEQIK